MRMLLSGCLSQLVSFSLLFICMEAMGEVTTAIFLVKREGNVIGREREDLDMV